MIRTVTQLSSRADRPWFSEVTAQIEGLRILVGGTAYVAGQPYPLAADVEIEPPAAGVEHHELLICTDGTLILDPSPQPSRPLYGQILWLDVPAGCSDLADVDVYRLVHVEEEVQA